MANGKDTKDNVTTAEQTARDAAKATEKATETTTRRAADAARQVGETAADTGADLTVRGAETARATARELTGTAHQVVDRTAEQMNRIFGLTGEARQEVAEQTQQNLDVFVQTGSVLMDGWQSIWKEWMNLAQETVHRRADAMTTIMRSRDLRSAYATHSELVKDEITSVLNRSVKVSELSARIANDAVRRINERAEQGARQARRRA